MRPKNLHEQLMERINYLEARLVLAEQEQVYIIKIQLDELKRFIP